MAERFFDRDRSEKERDRRLVELNVLAQMFYVKQQESVAQAIRDRGVQVHGFVFNTDTRECVRLLITPQ
jgi:carbonic anhydrase